MQPPALQLASGRGSQAAGCLAALDWLFGLRLPQFKRPTNKFLTQVDSFVVTVKLVAGLYIESQRFLVLFVDRQTERVSATQQRARQLRHATPSITFHPLFSVHVHAFEVGSLRGLSNDIGFENHSSIPHPNPYTVLFNASRGALTKAARIAIKRAGAAFLKRQQGVYLQHLLEVI